MRLFQMIEFDMLYCFFGIIICCIYRIFNKQNNKIQVIDIIISILLIVISAIRLNTGSDFYSYYIRYNYVLTQYDSIKSIFINSSSILFDLLCYLIKYSISGRYSIFAVTSLLFYFPIIIYFRKHNNKPYINVFAFIILSFYLITNNIIRHSFAMIILFYSNKYLDEKNYLKFFFLIFIASLFHKTVILAGILLFLSKKTIPSFINLIKANIIGLLGFLLFNVIIKIIDTFINSKYLFYIQNNYGNMVKQTIAVVGYIIFFEIITVLLIKNKDKIKNTSITSYYLINAFILAIPFSIIAVRCWPINRVAIYIYFFSIILIPDLIRVVENKNKILITFLMILWSLFIVIFSGDNEYYSYNTIFNDESSPNFPRNIVNDGWR